MVVNGPVIVKGFHAQLTTYQNPAVPRIYEGTIEQVDRGSNYLAIELIND